ncbi:hypothetical protein N0V90_004459 [Kalmusia sp. IMI 367209]|nr:hypothetical protein N0V90_004459 [Kalmusia sp. IMI 367209]
MALLQFISAGLPKVAIPTTVHSDHLIVSRDGAEQDLKRAAVDHREVYAFLSSASKKYGIGWWKPGAGIIHTTIFEHYAFPGGLIIGTDSHTPNAGGMGMLGIGVGGSDAVDAMAGMPWEVMCPEVLGVRLVGKLQGWSSTKDIICKLAGMLTVSGGKGKLTKVRINTTTVLSKSILTPSSHMSTDLFTPDLSHPLSQLKSAVLKSGWPVKVSHAMVGSCTNSSYEDLYKTQDLINQAKEAGIPHIKTPFMVSPGSEIIRATAEADGILQTLRDAGAVILSNSCGPCVGQWDRTDVDVKGRERNTVVSSFNRNFIGRHDSNSETCSFVTSPEMVIAFAYAGRIDFNPSTDAIPIGDSMQQFRFTPPTSIELPTTFIDGKDLYQPPQDDAAQLIVDIDPKSDRLQLLDPL